MFSARGLHLRSSGEVIRALLFFLLILFMYIGNAQHLEWGDTIPTRFLPLSLLREFNFDLDEFPFLYEKLIPYYLQYRNGQLVSSYPVGAALLAVPFYLLPVLAGISSQSPWRPFLEKLSAATIAVLSGFFFYLVLRRLASERAAMVATGLYALGTSTFSISSQALWQHGPSQFFLTLGLYLIVRGMDKKRLLPWSGLAFGAAVVCRPTDVLLMVPLFLYLARYRRGQLLTWTLFALPPALFFLAYDYVYFGSIFELGYGAAVLNPSSSHWGTPLGEGLLGVLVSPSKGLFVYSPILLLSCVGMYTVWKRGGDPFLRYLSLGPILVVLLYSKWHFWWGGETYGPRLIADITPFLALYLYPVWNAVEKRNILKTLFVVLAVVSLIMHAIGAYAFDASWYRQGGVNINDDRLWSWRDNPFVYHGKNLLWRNVSYVRTWVSGLSTSAQVPEELSAAMLLSDVPDRLLASQSMPLTIDITNTGDAIWLFQTPLGPGAVTLGWRWWQDERAVPYAEGRARLSRDIFPGEQEKLRLKLWPPSTPGRYTLQLGMVRSPDFWFSEQRMQLQVDGSCDFARTMEKDLALLPEAPRISVNLARFAYRPDEVGTVEFGIANGEVPRNLMFYIILEGPDGRLRFLTSPPTEVTPNPPCSSWTRIGHFHILSKHFSIHWRVGLQLREMTPGPHTLYA
ncbi:MAG: ArnT family glycosyltransferase, partial [Candidatus Entotheonellia bacterium]